MILSVIVPVYNAETTIRRCVDSILSQSNDDIEIILVDDGSMDGSVSIIESYAEAHNNVVAIHKTNGGVSSARNEGLRLSKGEWVAFVDADDSLCDGALRTMKEKAHTINSDFLIFQEYCGGDEKQNEPIIIEQFDYIRSVLCITGKKEIWGNLYKGSIARAILFNESLLIGEDLLFNIEFAFNTTKPITFLPKQVYCHNDNPYSIMHTQVNARRYENLIDCADILLGKYNYKEELKYEYIAFRVYNTLYPCFCNCSYPGKEVGNEIQDGAKECINLLPRGYARFIKAYWISPILAFIIFELTCIKKHGVKLFLKKINMS